MDIHDLIYTRTTIPLVVFEESGPREIEYVFSHLPTDDPKVMRDCAHVEREEQDAAQKLVWYALFCDLEIERDGQRTPFELEGLDLATRRAIIARVYEPMRAHLLKWRGFTAEEQVTIRLAEIIAEGSWGLYSIKGLDQTIDEANRIIRRKRNERSGNRQAAAVA
jgi:hypothetical protein